MRVTPWLALSVAGLTLLGCAGDEGPVIGGSDDGQSSDAPAEDPDAPPTTGGQGDDPAAGSDAVLGTETMAAIDAVVADGAARDAVEVRTAEWVTWPDGALGCPDDDMMYTQALIEGYRIVLDVDGEEVVFHGADGEPPFRCDDPQPPVDG